MRRSVEATQAAGKRDFPRRGGRSKQKRRCYQRRSGAPTRGTGPLRLALAGATRSTNVFPGDMISNIASFHVISFKPISAFTESLLYLDRWCGNAKLVRPDVE